MSYRHAPDQRGALCKHEKELRSFEYETEKMLCKDIHNRFLSVLDRTMAV